MDSDFEIRYEKIISLIGKLRIPNPKILEIGCGEFGMSHFTNLDVTATDYSLLSLKKTKNKKKVNLNVVWLPFKKNSFDIVICSETLEHIPQDKRKKAIQEMLHLAHYLIISFPCGKKTAKYERVFNKPYSKKYGRGHTWIEEHIKNGLPSEKILEDFKIIKKYKQTNIYVWFLQRYLRDICPNYLNVRELPNKFKFVTKYLNFGNCYRQIFVIENETKN